jgi:hypothetical protein
VFLGNIAVINGIYKTLSLKVVSFNRDHQSAPSVTTIINSFFAFYPHHCYLVMNAFPVGASCILCIVSANKGLSRMVLASFIGT